MRLPGLIQVFAVWLVVAGAGTALGGEFQIKWNIPEGGMIPKIYTCEGDNAPPTLEISGVPGAAKSLALIVDDPDAPSGTFTHWLVWNITPEATEIAGAMDTGPGYVILSKGKWVPGGEDGTNDFGKRGYSGPCPPTGTHRYFFRLSALDTRLKLNAGAARKEVDAAMQGHVIATATVMGRYAKTQ